MASTRSPVANTPSPKRAMAQQNSPTQPKPWLAAGTLTWRELVRFVRQRNRVFGALGQPIIFWLLLGSGLGPTFRMAGAEHLSYSQYFFPGTLVLVLLFTAIFATISIIEDRREGFLQSVLVAPIPRWSMVLGKVLGGTLLALGQSLLLLILGLTVGIHVGLFDLVNLVALLFTIAFALTGLGFLIAWRMDSTQGFHAIMSVFLLPMWLLSGAFFPAQSGWLYWVMRVNPLTYGVAGVRQLLHAGNTSLSTSTALAGMPSLTTCWIVTLGFAALMFALACKMAGQRTTGDLL